jgi:hypothetical protein
VVRGTECDRYGRYTAEPGTASEDRLRLLAGWAATEPTVTEPTRPRNR